MKPIIEFFLKKSIFGNTLTLLLLGWGIYAGFTISREAFPPIDFDIVIVTTIFPGASPAEIEKLVTQPIEEQLKGVEGIKEIRSSSIENRSGINIIIDPDAKDTKKVIEDIRSSVDRVTNLPKNVEKPIILEITSRQIPIIEVSLLSKDNSVDYQTLRNYAEILESKLKFIDSVARIDKRGWRDKEYIVKLDPYKTNNNYIGIEQILQALKQRNINFPGGEIITKGMSEIIRTVGEFVEISDIENLFIRSNEIGQGVRIKDIAKVVEDFAEDEYIHRTNGQFSITLTVVKKEKGDIITTVEEVKKITNEFKNILPENIQIELMNDLSFYVKRRLNILLNNAITGLILVIGSLFFFLGWRTSLIVALGLVLSLATTLIILKLLGITINLITMIGLIIVIGILVDDGIVVSENFYRYLEMGYKTYDAAIKGVSEVLAPVTASVFTTIITFAPLMFASGIFGKFLFYIPFVVIVSLIVSLFEAFFLMPAHLYDLNKYSKRKEIKIESGFFYHLRTKYYESILQWILKHKWITFFSLIFLFIFSFILQLVFGKFKLFTGAGEAFFIKMKANPTIPLEKMDEFNQYLSRVFMELPKTEIENFRTSTGISQQSPTDILTKRGSNYAMAIVYLTPENKRKRTGEEIVAQIREEISWLLDPKKRETNSQEKYKIFDEYKHLEGKLDILQIDLLRGGPPVGRPVAIEIIGNDYKILKKIAEEFKEKLKNIKGVKSIDDDYELGKYEIQLKINEKLAAITRVNVESISLVVNTAFKGVVPTTIKKGTEEIDIRVRYDDAYYKSLETLNQLYVLNDFGQLIPIKKMIQIEKKQGIVAYNHLNGERMVSVYADIDERITTSAEVNKEIKKYINPIISKYPGYVVRLGGENKDTEESIDSLKKAFLVGNVINFMILSSMFGSIILPFIILLTIPFALIGIFITYTLHQEPLSFLGLVGFVGVAGVVVNNAIVMIDLAINLKKQNPELSYENAIIQAASTRLRPIILTTQTTVLGLIPTAYGIGGKDPFLVPLCLSLAWGLVFATFLTLFIIPLFYVKAMNMIEFIKKQLKLKEY